MSEGVKHAPFLEALLRDFMEGAPVTSERARHALTRALPALARAEGFRARQVRGTWCARRLGHQPEPSFQEVWSALLAATDNNPHLLTYLSACERRTRRAMADAVRSRHLLRQGAPAAEVERHLATQSPGQPLEEEATALREKVAQLRQEVETLTLAGFTARCERDAAVERCGGLEAAGGSRVTAAAGPDVEVATWAPLRADSTVSILHADGPCRARFPADMPLLTLDGELAASDMLRVGLPEAVEGVERAELVVSVVALSVVERFPHHHLVGSVTSVERASPTALAVALYDALRETLEFKLLARAADLRGPLLLLKWSASAIQALRHPAPEDGGTAE